MATITYELSSTTQAKMDYESKKIRPISNYSDEDVEEDLWDERLSSGGKGQESKSIKDFEDKVLNSTYAISPLKPLSHFLHLGTLVGVFPAESGDRKIRFALTFSIKTIWAILFTLLWLGLGVGVATYTCMFNDTSSLGSAFEVKTNETALLLTSTDQLVVICTPWILVGAWLLFLILSWTRINKYGDLCTKFCQRGFRIGEEPETWTLMQFGINYLIFLVGQAIANIHMALVYCPTLEKQIIFSVVITIWMLPPYTVIVFSSYIFLQFCRTLSANFQQLRHEISDKSKQVKKRNLFYSEVIKRGLPRRYDRLHDNLELMADVFAIVLFFEYIFDVFAMLVSLYLSISSLINGVKTASVPWWMVGYSLLILHYFLKMYQLANVGHQLKEEMERVLTMISQFAFIHGDTNLLCLALLRRPPEPPLTLSGFATLQRSLLSKTLAFVLVVMLLIANYKLDDYKDTQTNTGSIFDGLNLQKIN